MPFRFQRHDSLRLFLEISQYPSLSAAATALNMTKGAVSYQIKALEDELQSKLLHRRSRGVSLSNQGAALVATCRPLYEAIETDLRKAFETRDQTLTVGLSSYFAARWLSPRLMDFMEQHPNTRLRLQPMTKLFDLDDQGVDIAIRWGNGQWDDAKIEPFLSMPAWPVGNREAMEKVERLGLTAAFAEFVLLRDHDDSDAWSNWGIQSGLKSGTRRDTLIIPDPNVRVQAVLNGQGIALMDDLVSPEVRDGSLLRLSEFELSDYGYFIVEPFDAPTVPAVRDFVGWLRTTAHQ